MLVDSGASRSLIKLAVAELLGVELQTSSVTYRMRLSLSSSAPRSAAQLEDRPLPADSDPVL